MDNEIYNIVKKKNPNNPLEYALNAVKPLAIEKVTEYILNCRQCDICKYNIKSIPCGNPNASVLIISDCVSYEDYEENLKETKVVYPLSDELGMNLWNMLSENNLNTDEIFVTNVVNCFPKSNKGQVYTKRAPRVSERNYCKNYLDYIIKTVDPIIIICLGATAINAINEEIGKQSVNNIRGKFFNYRGIAVMPTFSPGYSSELKEADLISKASKNEEYFEKDILTAFNYVAENYPHINIYNEVVNNG